MSARTAVLLVPMALTTLAQATPVTYDIQFTVEYIDTTSGSPPPDPRVQIGDVYGGSITVDSGFLAVDGINRGSSLLGFSIVMEDVAWTLGDGQSYFAGFNGPTGFSSESPGIDVSGGQITNLRGGVFGSADYPFVDFSIDPRLPYWPQDSGCSGSYCGNLANAFSTFNPLGAFGGTMSFAPAEVNVPEPGTLALAVLSLGLLVAVGRAGGRPRPARAGGREAARRPV